jgi:hypothetical protein
MSKEDEKCLKKWIILAPIFFSFFQRTENMLVFVETTL